VSVSCPVSVSMLHNCVKCPAPTHVVTFDYFMFSSFTGVDVSVSDVSASQINNSDSNPNLKHN